MKFVEFLNKTSKLITPAILKREFKEEFGLIRPKIKVVICTLKKIIKILKLSMLNMIIQRIRLLNGSLLTKVVDKMMNNSLFLMKVQKTIFSIHFNSKICI